MWLEITLWALVVVGVITGIALWYVYTFVYKHHVTIREVINGRKFIIKDKACEYVDDNKNRWWKLYSEKDKTKRMMPIPEEEAIDITKGGKKWVETYRTEQGEYSYIQDMNDAQETKPFKPFTKGDRLSLVQAITKAETRRKDDWKTNLPTYLAIGGWLVMVVMILIFAPDVIKTYTDGATQISNSMEQYEHIRHNNLLEEQKNWEKISQGIQTIRGENVNIINRLEAIENGTA
jgi:hypothetical protein